MAISFGENMNVQYARMQNPSKKMENVVSLVDERDVLEIIKNQRRTLRKYEEVNELIGRFNDVSEKTYQEAQIRFANHVKILGSLKKDLDTIFRKIRFLKEKLQQQYPGAFEATADAIKGLIDHYNLETEDDEEFDNGKSERKEPEQLISNDAEAAVSPSEAGDENIEPQCEHEKEDEIIRTEVTDTLHFAVDDKTNENITETNITEEEPILIDPIQHMRASSLAYVEDSENASD